MDFPVRIRPSDLYKTIGFASAFVLIQWLLEHDYGVSACMVLGAIFLAPDWRCTPHRTCISREPLTRADVFLIALIWASALTLRIYRIDSFHNIGDLSARYGYAAVQIMKGNHLFPFMPLFEYDETLTAYLLVPWLKLFGLTWTNLKIISVGYASLLIPAVYILTGILYGRIPAIFASGFTVLSRYFYRCDPLPGLLKFNLVAVCYILSLAMVYRTGKTSRWIPAAVRLSILSSLAMYIHSSGRIVGVAVLAAIGLLWLRKTPKIPWNPAAMIILYLTSVALLCLPLFSAFIRTSDYFFFKNRQIFGLHENYPFSLTGLIRNIWSLVVNFNYSARLHAMFDERVPLLFFLTAALFLCGLWFLSRTAGRIESQILLLGFFLASAPLILITPGNWRGLYFAPSTAMATLIGGVAAGVILNAVLPAGTAVRTVLTLAILGAVAWNRVPEMIAGSPLIGTQATLLFEDLRDEPDVPHFFSRNLDQCAPHLSIYEFTKGAYFDEYHVMLFDPLRYMIGYESETELSPGTLEGRAAVLVFSPSDRKYENTLRKVFRGSKIGVLPRSGIRVLRIPQTDRSASP
ncbi:hypothetical protein JXA40_03475 [bacterium]|nr:hypothetical protein [candidate division CSSED10-310 bacterium]